MSWKNIKSFLIILFIIINVYLLVSTYGLDFERKDTSYSDPDAIENTVTIIKKNYNISIDKSIIPTKLKNLPIVDVTNIIYTDKFKNSKYNFDTKGSVFEAQIKSDTFSYNEDNAKEQFVQILADIGIESDSYELNSQKTDYGLICSANGIASSYPVFNSIITATFSSNSITIRGRWHIAPKKADENSKPQSMTDITGVIIGLSDSIARSDGSAIKITDISYGYYISYYDENSVSKSSSAIPCYMLSADDGSKYYYDALTGKKLD